jgi:hypothetical protein
MLSRALFRAAITLLIASEGTDELFLRHRAQALTRLHGVITNDQVHAASEQNGQLMLDFAQIERAEKRLPPALALVEVDHDVDVTSRLGRVTRNRAEKIGARDAEFGETLAMASKVFDGV